MNVDLVPMMEQHIATGADVTIPARAYVPKGAVINAENPHQPEKEA